jgi:hypothetical protein
VETWEHGRREVRVPSEPIRMVNKKKSNIIEQKRVLSNGQVWGNEVAHTPSPSPYIALVVTVIRLSKSSLLRGITFDAPSSLLLGWSQLCEKTDVSLSHTLRAQASRALQI